MIGNPSYGSRDGRGAVPLNFAEDEDTLDVFPSAIGDPSARDLINSTPLSYAKYEDISNRITSEYFGINSTDNRTASATHYAVHSEN